MPTLNSTIKPAHHPLSDVVRLFKDERYIVDDRFQRRLVWTPKQKVRLIETILMGYPMPDVYLHQKEADAEGQQVFSIVDGQQRITTIVQFASDEWAIEKKYLDKDHHDSDYAGLRWSQLPTALKKVYWAYTINSRIIPPEVTDDEIRRIFRRLNESDKSLNPQELRHAEFSGRIILLAEQIADHRFWSDWEIFTANNIRRMADVEVATSLIAFLRNGIVTDSAESVNYLYDLYNDTYKEEKSDRATIISFLEKVDDIFSRDDKVASFFSKPIHIYTLFTVFNSDINLRYINKLTAALRKFSDMYEGKENPSKSAVKFISMYRNGSVQRTRSRTSRLQRNDGLLRFLKLEGL